MVRPGDTLVLALDSSLNPAQMQEFKKQLDERLSGVKTLIIGGDIHLYVLRPGELADGLADEQVKAAAEHYGLSEDYIRGLPKHQPDCGIVTTHHLTCTCGAYRATGEVAE